MRFFELLNNQHIFIYLFPGLLFVIFFGLYLGYTHFRSEGDEQRKADILHRFPEGFEDRDAPFPMGLALTIIGIVTWMIFYIFFIGINRVVI